MPDLLTVNIDAGKLALKLQRDEVASWQSIAFVSHCTELKRLSYVLLDVTPTGCRPTNVTTNENIACVLHPILSRSPLHQVPICLRNHPDR